MAGPHQVVRIVVRGTALATGELRTKNVVNVYDFYRTSLGPATNKTNIKAGFKTTILTPLGNALSVSYVKNTIDLRFIDDFLDPFVSFVDGVNGAVTGDSLPSRECALMQMKTGVRGKHYRGFKFFGPLAESRTTLDYINSTSITEFGTFQTAYLAGFTDSDGNTWLPYLVAAKLSNLKVDPPVIVGTPITSVTVNVAITELKRRGQTHPATV